MTAFAFTLVVLVVVVLVAVIAMLLREVDRQRAENRRLTDRLVNALVADDAAEMAGLDSQTVAADFAARERQAREARESRAVARRGAMTPAQRPTGAVVGME